jgi:hypothetical protein
MLRDERSQNTVQLTIKLKLKLKKKLKGMLLWIGTVK